MSLLLEYSSILSMKLIHGTLQRALTDYMLDRNLPVNHYMHIMTIYTPTLAWGEYHLSALNH